MFTHLRLLAAPVACALTGAASGLLAFTLAASPVAPPVVQHACEPATAPAEPSDASAEPSDAPAEPASLDDAVQCAEEGRCTVTRALLDELFANPGQMSRVARVMPAIKNGETRGFKFYGLRADSLPERLGLRNGDLVSAVNGTPLTSLDAVMGLLSQLRRLAVLDVELMRRGETRRLRVEIR